MIGSCFCEGVKFEVYGIVPKLYQCHCSMCRKVTSSTSNTAFIIPKENFKWIAGNNNIKTYRKPTGYRVDFCIDCGSTVPNEYRDKEMWIPAGLLDETLNLNISNHLCVSSRASWDEISDVGKQYDGVPEMHHITSP
ncbi:MAG: GFA family protein [Oceanospirillaceae bacterium]|nr:GFA family protein [Oceanospirillaceae bacterium]